MRKTFLYVLMAAAALTTCTLAACSDDDDDIDSENYSGDISVAELNTTQEIMEHFVLFELDDDGNPTTTFERHGMYYTTHDETDDKMAVYVLRDEETVDSVFYDIIPEGAAVTIEGNIMTYSYVQNGVPYAVRCTKTSDTEATISLPVVEPYSNYVTSVRITNTIGTNEHFVSDITDENGNPLYEEGGPYVISRAHFFLQSSNRRDEYLHVVRNGPVAVPYYCYQTFLNIEARFFRPSSGIFDMSRVMTVDGDDYSRIILPYSITTNSVYDKGYFLPTADELKQLCKCLDLQDPIRPIEGFVSHVNHYAGKHPDEELPVIRGEGNYDQHYYDIPEIFSILFGDADDYEGNLKFATRTKANPTFGHKCVQYVDFGDISKSGIATTGWKYKNSQTQLNVMYIVILNAEDDDNNNEE